MLFCIISVGRVDSDWFALMQVSVCTCTVCVGGCDTEGLVDNLQTGLSELSRVPVLILEYLLIHKHKYFSNKVWVLHLVFYWNRPAADEPEPRLLNAPAFPEAVLQSKYVFPMSVATGTLQSKVANVPEGIHKSHSVDVRNVLYFLYFKLKVRSYLDKIRTSFNKLQIRHRSDHNPSLFSQLHVNQVDPPVGV